MFWTSTSQFNLACVTGKRTVTAWSIKRYKAVSPCVCVLCAVVWGVSPKSPKGEKYSGCGIKFEGVVVVHVSRRRTWNLAATLAATWQCDGNSIEMSWGTIESYWQLTIDNTVNCEVIAIGYFLNHQLIHRLPSIYLRWWSFCDYLSQCASYSRSQDLLQINVIFHRAQNQSIFRSRIRWKTSLSVD